MLEARRYPTAPAAEHLRERLAGEEGVRYRGAAPAGRVDGPLTILEAVYKPDRPAPPGGSAHPSAWTSATCGVPCLAQKKKKKSASA